MNLFVFFFYPPYVYNRLNPTYDQALNNLGNLIKVEFECCFITVFFLLLFDLRGEVEACVAL